MEPDHDRVADAAGRLFAGDAEAIVELLGTYCALLIDVTHSTRLSASDRPTAAGWVFSGDLDDSDVAVVLASDGAARAVSIILPARLAGLCPEPGDYGAYSVRFLDGTVEVELGPELAREIVERADIAALRLRPRPWSVTAREAIRTAIDGDRTLEPHAPPGWRPGPTARQRAVRDLLERTGIGLAERAAQLADLLLACGAPDVDIDVDNPFDDRPRYTLSVRFGDEVQLWVDWEHLEDPNERVALATIVYDTLLHLIGTAFEVEVTDIASELLRALAARHRAFAETPFGTTTHDG